jgi:hypothetical protein
MTLLRLSAVLTLIGLAFMAWSLVRPTPLPVILAMSVGQVFGTTAFALYLVVLWREAIVKRRERRASAPPLGKAE